MSYFYFFKLVFIKTWPVFGPRLQKGLERIGLELFKTAMQEERDSYVWWVPKAMSSLAWNMNNFHLKMKTLLRNLSLQPLASLRGSYLAEANVWERLALLKEPCLGLPLVSMDDQNRTTSENQNRAVKSQLQITYHFLLDKQLKTPQKKTG